MELFSIDKCVQRTSPKSDKIFKEVELTMADGGAIQTTAWLNPGENDEWFESLKEGDRVEGIITKAGYFSSGQRPTHPSPTKAQAHDDFKSDIRQAVADKRRDIKSFQADKKDSMLFFTSAREAGNFLLIGWHKMTPEERAKLLDDWAELRAVIYTALKKEMK